MLPSFFVLDICRHCCACLLTSGMLHMFATSLRWSAGKVIVLCMYVECLTESLYCDVYFSACVSFCVGISLVDVFCVVQSSLSPFCMCIMTAFHIVICTFRLLSASLHFAPCFSCQVASSVGLPLQSSFNCNTYVARCYEFFYSLVT